MQQDVIEHTIIFSESITEDTVQDLITKMSNYSFVNLYFSTVGGELHSMQILCDYLNRRNSQKNIRVYIGPYLLSAGTLLLIHYDGPLYMTNSFRYFMFHAPDISLFTIRVSKHEKRLKKFLDENNELYYNSLLKIGLTKSDINKIKAGEDVYVFRDELNKIKVNFYSDDEKIITNNYYLYKAPESK